MKSKEIHPFFKLNGQAYTKESLSEMAIALIKDGEPHEKELGQLILQWFDENKYVILLTSGTTGNPKEIKLSKKAMVHSAKATATFFGLKKGDKALLCLPTRYIAGKMMFIRALVLGLDLDYVVPSASPLDNNTTVYDFVAMVPLQVQNSLSKLNNIRKLIVGGAKLSPAVKELLLDKKCEIYETYGMTETITHIAAKRIEDDFFTPLPHAKVSVDERNCLVIHAPSVNKEAIITNDLVELKDDDTFRWLGRIDNVINSGGVKLFPEQIEEKLAHYISNRFFVIGKDDEVLGNKLVLVIESEPYELTEETFLELHAYEKPKEIQFVTSFKETPTGKILRRDNLQ